MFKNTCFIYIYLTCYYFNCHEGRNSQLHRIENLILLSATAKNNKKRSKILNDKKNTINHVDLRSIDGIQKPRPPEFIFVPSTCCTFVSATQDSNSCFCAETTTITAGLAVCWCIWCWSLCCLHCCIPEPLLLMLLQSGLPGQGGTTVAAFIGWPPEAQQHDFLLSSTF